MRRLTFLLVIVVSLLLAAGCGKFGERYKASSNDTGVNGKERKITQADFEDDKVRLADGCDKLFTEKSEGRSHTSSVDEKVDYKHNPPLSGNHYQVPGDWGLYPTQSLKDVETTHNLEHGHIVITFKGLTDSQRDELYDNARENPFHLLVMPRKQNPKDGVYYTVWTHQIYCKQPSKAALQYMIDNYRDQGPELFMEDQQKK
jgi:hypothetical protein